MAINLVNREYSAGSAIRITTKDSGELPSVYRGDDTEVAQLSLEYPFYDFTANLVNARIELKDSNFRSFNPPIYAGTYSNPVSDPRAKVTLDVIIPTIGSVPQLGRAIFVFFLAADKMADLNFSGSRNSLTVLWDLQCIFDEGNGEIVKTPFKGSLPISRDITLRSGA